MKAVVIRGVSVVLLAAMGVFQMIKGEAFGAFATGMLLTIWTDSFLDALKRYLTRRKIEREYKAAIDHLMKHGVQVLDRDPE